MNGIKIFTDKNHTLATEEVFPSLRMDSADTLVIGNEASTDFLGFGVAITGASCYNLSLMEAGEREEFLRKIYSKDGLNLSVGRLCVGASDYSAELYSYDDVEGDTELKHFSVDRDRRYIIPMIKEIIKINPDIFLFASPWSPPGWMKTGGSMCGGYMREEFVDCYADYYIKFLKAYADEGIKISALTPQNEPNTGQHGFMPACIWHPEIEAKFITTLRRKLDAEGMNVKIWLFDHSFIDIPRVLWSLDNCEGLAESCDAVAFHYYDGAVENTKAVTERYPNLPLHFTEGGPRLYDNYSTDWCKWSMMIAKSLSCGYKSFTGWNLMLNEIGGPNIGPFFCGGLATRNSVTGELSYSGQYAAFSHIAPYINKNSKIYPIGENEYFGRDMFRYPAPKTPICGIAVDNSDGKTVLLLINPDADKRQTQININGQWWYIELMPDTVSTVIIE